MPTYKACDNSIPHRPDLLQGLECYVNNHFTDDWKYVDQYSPESIFPRTGYIIMHTECPITLGRKSQPDIILGTTESEYGILFGCPACKRLFPT